MLTDLLTDWLPHWNIDLFECFEHMVRQTRTTTRDKTGIVTRKTKRLTKTKTKRLTKTKLKDWLKDWHFFFVVVSVDQLAYWTGMADEGGKFLASGRFWTVARMSLSCKLKAVPYYKIITIFFWKYTRKVQNCHSKSPKLSLITSKIVTDYW